MAECQNAFFIKNDEGKSVLIPCQKCLRCKRRRITTWTFRLMQELNQSTSAKFITLTYDDNNMPITRNGYRSLLRYDLELFFKKLRRSHSKKKNPGRAIKYLAAGEYGGKIGRPHFHCILFNADINKIQDAWSTHHVVNTTIRLKRRNRYGQISKVITQVKRQPIGHINYGDKRGVSEASVGYCLKYCLKPKQHKRRKNDDSEKEFITFSKGLGLSYIYDQLPQYTMAWNDQTGKKQKVLIKPGVLSKMVRYHHTDKENRMFVTFMGGKKAAMPRYYKDRIYTDKERKAIGETMRNKLAEDILKQFLRYSAQDNQKAQYNKKERIKHDHKLQSQLKSKSYG